MNIALFLGAGASVPYNKPTLKALHDVLLKRLDYHNNFLSDFPDTEHALTALQNITRFSKTEGGKWWSKHRDSLDVEEWQKLEKKVHAEIYKIYAWTHDSDVKATIIFSSIFGLIHELKSEITVFTTNYDRSIEEYCGQSEDSLRCVDGFSPRSGRYVWTGYETSSNENDSIRNVLLYKLHGSLDWAMHRRAGRIRTGVEQIYTLTPNHEKNLLIYPALSKNNTESDSLFNIIFDKFTTKLASQDACVVVGFSFRDKRIRERLAEFVNAGKKLVIVDPDKNADFQKIILQALPDHEQEHPKQNIHHIREKLNADTVDSTIDQIRDLVLGVRTSKDENVLVPRATDDSASQARARPDEAD